MPVVQLPPGCEGFTVGGNVKYRGRAGGAVSVSDEHAAQLDAMPGNGTAGLITARFRGVLGTRKSRICRPCNKVWQAWTTHCHKCGKPTELS